MPGASGNWAANYMSSGPSNGPSISGSAPLPANTENFGKDVKDAQDKYAKNKQGNVPDVQGSQGPMAGDSTQYSYGTDANVGGSTFGANAGGASDSVLTNDTQMAARGGKICEGPHKSHVANYLAGGGKVPAMVSAGEIYLTPDKVQKVVNEGANPLKIGQKFQGKAKVKGDSFKNDTIPMDLDEGGVVIDRKTVNMKSPEKAELFVHRALAKKKVK